MSESPSRLIKIADPSQPTMPHHRISGKAEPVRIFQKDWMEFFTLISFKTFLVYCALFESIILTFVFLYNNIFSNVLSYFFLGLILWLLTEYILHRFVFHFASNKKFVQRLVYIFHGNHHMQPNHPYRTLMPLIVTLPVGVLIWGVCIQMTSIGMGSAIFSGFFAGYTFYDFLHFATHNFKMKSFPFSIWKRHHLLHHYRTEEHNYSITTPWLDTLFRTKYKP